MARKNPRPIGADGIGGLPDGQFTSVSERINRTGLAFLEKRTGGDGSITLTYTNRRGEPQSLNAGGWLRKYNDVYFNRIGHRPPPEAPNQPAPVVGRSWIATGICVVIGLGLFYAGYLAAGG